MFEAAFERSSQSKVLSELFEKLGAQKTKDSFTFN